MQCPKCGAENASELTACAACGTSLVAAAFESPTEKPIQAEIAQGAGDSTGGVIPYKNPQALSAYYLGIFSGFPLIGLPLGIAAFVLGILGLRARKRNPAIKGSVHAAIGIGCGGFFALFWGAVIVMVTIAVISES